ncbi:MAG TPA: kynureninase, partial [Rhizobiales bacterium]|nr:kynureninase [Hyphomicrobiales bacterium]
MPVIRNERDFYRNSTLSITPTTNDPLASYRDLFHLPEGVIYLDGNSLGAMPKSAPDIMARAVEGEWANGLIRSWNDAGWWQLPVELGNKIGRLVGAGQGTTIVTDSTSINIFKALHAALALRPDRTAIIAEAGAFPTDLYIAESAGKNIERRLIGQDNKTLDDLLDENVAVVLLSHVDYRSGELLDMQAITEKVHKAGALIIWDLCHSAGVVPMGLDAAGVDFAVGCTYKYLNGGPGSPAFIYANQSHHDHITQPLTGWWAHAEPFAFKPDFEAAPGIRAFLCGTQPILSMRALGAALDITDGIDMAEVRQKSKALTTLFAERVIEKTARYGVTLFSPSDADKRGSQVSFTHPNGYQIMQALIARGVIGDFRQP